MAGLLSSGNNCSMGSPGYIFCPDAACKLPELALVGSLEKMERAAIPPGDRGPRVQLPQGRQPLRGTAFYGCVTT